MGPSERCERSLYKGSQDCCSFPVTALLLHHYSATPPHPRTWLPRIHFQLPFGLPSPLRQPLRLAENERATESQQGRGGLAAPPGQQDVGGLDVAVHDVACVHVGEPEADLAEDVHGAVLRPGVLHALAPGRPLHRRATGRSKEKLRTGTPLHIEPATPDQGRSVCRCQNVLFLF